MPPLVLLVPPTGFELPFVHLGSHLLLIGIEDIMN